MIDEQMAIRIKISWNHHIDLQDFNIMASNL